MKVKVIALNNKGYDAAVAMSSEFGITYYELLRLFDNSPAKVYQYLNTVSELIEQLSDSYKAQGIRFIDNWPWLQQEGEEGDIWEGQPVVCDGWFELKNDELWFSGNRFTHGEGGAVSRKIHKHNIIEWHRCEDIRHYGGEWRP